MTDKPTKIYPQYDDFEELDVSIKDVATGSTLSVLTSVLRGHSTTGVIAILTLLVVGLGFYTTDHIWGLFAVDVLIVSFSTFNILISETRGKKQKETPCCAHESGDEPEGPRKT